MTNRLTLNVKSCRLCDVFITQVQLTFGIPDIPMQLLLNRSLFMYSDFTFDIQYTPNIIQTCKRETQLELRHWKNAILLTMHWHFPNCGLQSRPALLCMYQYGFPQLKHLSWQTEEFHLTLLLWGITCCLDGCEGPAGPGYFCLMSSSCCKLLSHAVLL